MSLLGEEMKEDYVLKKGCVDILISFAKSVSSKLLVYYHQICALVIVNKFDVDLTFFFFGLNLAFILFFITCTSKSQPIQIYEWMLHLSHLNLLLLLQLHITIFVLFFK